MNENLFRKCLQIFKYKLFFFYILCLKYTDFLVIAGWWVFKFKYACSHVLVQFFFLKDFIRYETLKFTSLFVIGIFIYLCLIRIDRSTMLVSKFLVFVKLVIFPHLVSAYDSTVKKVHFYSHSFHVCFLTLVLSSAFPILSFCKAGIFSPSCSYDGRTVKKVAPFSLSYWVTQKLPQSVL